MAKETDLGRANYKAFRDGTRIEIHAFGVHPTAGYRDALVALEIMIFPPQYSFHSKAPTGPVLEVLTPFNVSAFFHDEGNKAEVINVHDADGEHKVIIDPIDKFI